MNNAWKLGIEEEGKQLNAQHLQGIHLMVEGGDRKRKEAR